MRIRSLGVLVFVALVASAPIRPVQAADPPHRKLLSTEERNAALNLIKAVDLAQETDVLSDEGPGWAHHVLKSTDQTAFGTPEQFPVVAA